MNNKIKIGIPRGLLYYRYNVLWKEFFKQLGCDIIISPETNDEILQNGKKYSNYEMCLSLKIYIGHVFYLQDKVDYILVPRIACERIGTETCSNICSLYDIINNIFDLNILNYNVDEINGKTEESAFIKIGEKLGFGKNFIQSVYHIAKKEEYKQNKINYLIQKKKLERDKHKVLIVSHNYNVFDAIVGKKITKILNNYDYEVIYACVSNPDNVKDSFKSITKNLKLKYNQELLNSLTEYKDSINSIVLLSTFPCVPDSVINEIILRKISVPIIKIVVDDKLEDDKIFSKIEYLRNMIKGEKNE